MKPTEIIDLDADPELAWLSRMFSTAKKNLEECALSGGNFMPVCFMGDGDGTLNVFGFPIRDEREERAVIDFLRKMAKDKRATDLMVIHDTFVSSCEDDLDARRLLMEDPRAWCSWSPEYKQRVGFRRREALFAHAELKGGLRTMILNQFYRREGGRVVFEECLSEQMGFVVDGPWTRLLPPRPADDGGDSNP